MNKQTEVIIIGGGAIGLCCAYYLWEKGLCSTIIEKKDIGAGSSWGNAGLIVPSHFIPLAAPGVISKGLKWMFNPESPFYIKPRLDAKLWSWLWKFAKSCNEKHKLRSIRLLRDMHVASTELYERLANIKGVDFGFQREGLLLIYNSKHGEEECDEIAELADEVELDAKKLNTEQMNEMDPNLNTTADGGVYFKQDAHLNPSSFLKALEDFLKNNDITIKTQTEVLSFEKIDRKITKIKTTQGDFSANIVVLAGGAWSPVIVEDLQLKLPIQPAKGYSITFPRKQIPRIPVVCTEAKIAVTPLADKLRFAGTLELAGFNMSINQRRINAILKAVPKYFADIEPNHSDEPELWAGLRPCSPDGLPFIGRFNSIQNLIVAAGHAMIGISLAPITGRLIAELVLEEKPSIDLSLLSPDRFN